MENEISIGYEKLKNILSECEQIIGLFPNSRDQIIELYKGEATRYFNYRVTLSLKTTISDLDIKVFKKLPEGWDFNKGELHTVEIQDKHGFMIILEFVKIF